eukprot:TRINITY_DN11981_c0_g1_i1.p1 TRINITY_DN11981_c0_g1~~TRINITY_DN11981_c0_g1_i1.p1  ORF type:complete len:271 (+),score=37.04 TRINITY_DN11981_c0_g1_i1:44-856(+)
MASRVHLLRIGKSHLLTMRLQLHNPKAFNEYLFQHLLSSIRERLPDYLSVDVIDGEFTTKYTTLTSDQPAHYRDDKLQFIFYFSDINPRFHFMMRDRTYKRNPVVKEPKLELDNKGSSPSSINTESSVEQPSIIVRGGFVSEVIGKKKNRNAPPMIIEKIKEEDDVSLKRTLNPDSETWSKFDDMEIMPQFLIVETFPYDIDLEQYREITSMSSTSGHQQIISHYFNSSGGSGSDIVPSDTDSNKASKSNNKKRKKPDSGSTTIKSKKKK